MWTGRIAGMHPWPPGSFRVRRCRLRYGFLIALAAATATVLAWGSRAPLGWALVLHGVAYGAFAAILVGERRRPQLPRRAVLGVGAGLLLVAVIAPPAQ